MEQRGRDGEGRLHGRRVHGLREADLLVRRHVDARSEVVGAPDADARSSRVEDDAALEGPGHLRAEGRAAHVRDPRAERGRVVRRGRQHDTGREPDRLGRPVVDHRARYGRGGGVVRQGEGRVVERRRVHVHVEGRRQGDVERDARREVGGYRRGYVGLQQARRRSAGASTPASREQQAAEVPSSERMRGPTEVETGHDRARRWAGFGVCGDRR